MGPLKKVFNVMILWGVFLLIFVTESKQEHNKEFSLEDPKLCSPITKRKVRYESIIVNQGRSINHHSVPWNIPQLCKFEVQSSYSKGGVLAVIQKLNLRRNATTGECIDYIQFRAKKGSISQRHCGYLDASVAMNYYMDSDDDTFSISYSNSFIDGDGELDVIVFIAKEPLSFNERTELVVMFTSYKDCSESYSVKHVTLLECVHEFSSVCINKKFFGDGYINCPYYGCVDEDGCFTQVGPPGESKGAIAKRVIIGSISTFGIVFGVFILFIWVFKKHKLFCWAEDFAHPTTTPENNRNSRLMEMNHHTGARLADSPEVQPTAPVVELDKDLPPSYDSLFPTAPPPDVPPRPS